MGKKIDNSVLDAALNELKNKCNKMTACAGEPATFADANNGGTNFLADVTMAPADLIVADGDTSGRKVTVAQKTGVNVDTTGTADHVALLDTVGSVLLLVTTATAQALTSGNTMTFNSWKDEIADPA